MFDTPQHLGIFDEVAKCHRHRITWRQLLTDLDWPLLAIDCQVRPEVYSILDSVGVSIYVGSSIDVLDRLLSHVGRGTFDRPFYFHWIKLCPRRRNVG